MNNQKLQLVVRNKILQTEKGRLRNKFWKSRKRRKRLRKIRFKRKKKRN